VVAGALRVLVFTLSKNASAKSNALGTFGAEFIGLLICFFM
jgi:hypothetical protein